MKERFFCERNDMVKNERIATELRKEDFYYDLPQAQIAQHPAEPRDAARLMVIDRASGEIAHRHFYDILDYIRPEDVLVVNDSKVIPARLYGTDAEKSDRVVEFLLLRRRGDRAWETLVRPGKKAKIGKKFIFGDGLLEGEITDIVEEGNRIVTFSRPTSPKSWRTTASIRRCMPARRAAPPRRLRGCISPRNCWIKSARGARRSCRSCCMSGSAPSARSRNRRSATM